MYEHTAITRPCHFSEESKNEFSALVSAGVVEKIVAALDWHGELPLLAGAVPQYGEYAVITPEKYFESSLPEVGSPEIQFLWEVRTAEPEKVRSEICRCCAALRIGYSGDGWQIFLADPTEGIQVNISGIFTEFKVRIKVIAVVEANANMTKEDCYLPEISPEWLFRAIVDYKGYAVGNVTGIRHKCRRAELVRSEYFPLSGCQRITVHLVSVYPDGSEEDETVTGGRWLHYTAAGGKVKCLHEGMGSKISYTQKIEGGRVWWKKSFYAEYIIDLAETECHENLKEHSVDFVQMEDELDDFVSGIMIAGKEFTGANIPEGEGGLIVRFDGTGEDGAEFSVSGLFAERLTALKSLSLLVTAFDKYGKWSIKETSVSMESTSGKLCWQLYMNLLL